MKPWAEQFYNSNAWHNTREAYLQSTGGMCERCSGLHDPVPAKIVHHRKKLTERSINNPAVSLSWDNLEALCQDCHNKEHHRSERVKRYRINSDGSLSPP